VPLSLESTMESKIQTIADNFYDNYKTAIFQKIDNIVSVATADELKTFINSLNNLTFKKEDFYVKKETPVVEMKDRCIAKRSDNTQCTRRKKKGCDLCGTHVKHSPNGIIEISTVNMKRKDVWVQEVMGIQYYIDSEDNVYNTEDVLEEKINPRIVGKINSDKNFITFTAL